MLLLFVIEEIDIYRQEFFKFMKLKLVKFFCIGFILIFLLSGCSSNTKDDELVEKDDPEEVSTEVEYTPPEILAPIFDGRDWRLANRKVIDWRVIREFLVDNEKYDSWTEMLITSFSSYKAETYLEMEMEQLRSGIESICVGAKWNIISQNIDEIKYEWFVDDCNEFGAQHEIGRFVQSEHGVHRIAYVVRQPKMETDQQLMWRQLIQQARIIDAD